MLSVWDNLFILFCCIICMGVGYNYVCMGLSVWEYG
jgi:hypothetical protein